MAPLRHALALMPASADAYAFWSDAIHHALRSRGLSHTRRESFDTFELTRDDEMAVASRTSRIAERFKRKKKKDSELDEIAKGFFPDQPDD